MVFGIIHHIFTGLKKMKMYGSTKLDGYDWEDNFLVDKDKVVKVVAFLYKWTMTNLPHSDEIGECKIEIWPICK